jgi:threonine dehydratase
MLRYEDIVQARQRIDGQLIVTPCTPSQGFGELFGGHAWFKFENLQRTGSFKERGALNRMLALSEDERRRGVVCASAGNHAQGVAYHARRLGIPATIVMPERTPLVKVTNTRGYGATVVLHGSVYDEAMQRALELRDAQGLTLIHPFDDERVMAGQGTIGLELLEQCPEMEVVVVSVGGGGLIGGIACAIKAQRPEVRVIGVEAAALPAAHHALEAGQVVTIDPGQTIADGIAVRRIGDHTFQAMREWVDEVVLVPEDEIADAVLLLLEKEKTVAEAASAATVAAVVNGRVGDVKGRNVVMVLSGGNIDVGVLSRIIDRGLRKDGRVADLRVVADDRPGALARLTTAIAEQGANVLQLNQRRSIGGLWLTEAEVDLTLETRGREHVVELVKHLRGLGYRVVQE